MADKRRKHGEGTIEKDKVRGCEFVKISYVDPKDGQTKRRKFKVDGKTEATLLKAHEWKEKVEKGRLLPKADKLKLGEWIDCWLEEYVKPNVRIKTYMKYKSSLDNYIKPFLGKKKVVDIRGHDIQIVLNQLRLTGGKDATGLSVITVKNTRRYLSMALDQAVYDYILALNPVKSTKVREKWKSVRHVLTDQEATSLLEAAKRMGQAPYMLLLLALSTGMRLGELLGLQWEDIGNNGTIHVQRAVATNVKGSPFQQPKSDRGLRQIPLPRDVYRELELYKTWQEDNIEKLGDKYTDMGLIITNTFGRVLDASRFTGVILKKLLIEAGINKPFTFHDLRHTHATMLLKRGIHPKIVQERLGHSTITITLDTYSHLIPDMQLVATQALEGQFTGEAEARKEIEIINHYMQ